MSNVLIQNGSMEDIADAIRVLNGSENTYKPRQMDDAIIAAIPTETASGNPIHITDAAAYPTVSCVTTLEPVQDLHGYDKPWPAGGGKNLCPPLSDWSVGFIKNNGTIGDEESYRHNKYSPFIKIEGTTSIVFSFKNGFPQTGTDNDHKAWRGIAFYDVNKDFISRSSQTDYGTTEIIEGSIPQNAVYIIVFCRTFSTTDEPMVEIGTTATSYEPYSNECPITGHTGVDLTQTGKNLLDFSAFYSTAQKTRASAKILDGGQISFKNTQTENIGWIGCATTSIGANVSPTNIYRVPAQKGNTFVAQFTCLYYEINLNNNVIARSSVKYANEPYTIQSDDCLAVTFRISPTEQEIPAGQTGIAGIAQIELGSTATAYELYQGQAYSITFPQEQSPVYGGEVDWTNGVLRVTEVNVDLGSLSWDARYEGETNGTYSTALPNVYYKTSSEFIAEQYMFNNAVGGINYLSNPDTRNVGIYSYNGTVDTEIAGCSKVLYMVVPINQNINGKLVYKLATPIEIPLTPEVITLLKGENNIWTDSGTSEVGYKVDLNSYIQKLIDEASGTVSTLNTSPLSLNKSAELTSTGGENVDEPVLYDEVKVSDDEEVEEMSIEEEMNHE